MKFLKKVTAILIIATIALSSTITSATNTAINGATTVASGFATTSTITVTKTGEFPDGDEIASASITNLDGTAASTTTLTVGGDNADADTSVLTVATADLVNNTSYIISFTTTSGDFGTATVRIGTPTNDTLTVTATVQPVLKFAMESNSKAFGVLTSSYAGVTTGLEVGTNAVNGVTISAQTTNGGLISSTASHTINLSGNDTLYSAEGYQFLSTLGTADSTSAPTITGVTATTMNTTNQTVTVYSANKPQNFDTVGDYDVDFTVQAKIAESTPSASDYTDVIIFTATANF